MSQASLTTNLKCCLLTLTAWCAFLKSWASKASPLHSQISPGMETQHQGHTDWAAFPDAHTPSMDLSHLSLQQIIGSSTACRELLPGIRALSNLTCL